jgi:purine-nucleoside/S-methyl-5'-thioadenosine phosphorylase / adenosine deaminase
METLRRRDIEYLRFPILKKYENELWHGVFTRLGGTSLPPYDSLNLGTLVGDKPEDVAKNRDLVREICSCRELVALKQVHGKRVIHVTDSYPARDEVLEADALITNVKNKALVIQLADCQGIFLFDPIKKAVANIHSGWRSSLQNIVAESVLQMQNAFGAKPADIIATVSPSLGPCCSEFLDYKKDFGDKAEEMEKYHVGNSHFDFWQLTTDQLLNVGVKKENIELSKICSACNTDRFFSYRAQTVTGRFGTVIYLK